MQATYFIISVAQLIFITAVTLLALTLVPPLFFILFQMMWRRPMFKAKSKLDDLSSATTKPNDGYSEKQWITERRKATQTPEQDQLTGLALSGGGIRAAFIARGLIEELVRRKKFKKFDYISGVSGGAYTVGSILNTFESKLQLPLSSKYKKISPDIDYKGLLSVAFDFLFNVFPILLFLSLFQYILSLSQSYSIVLFVSIGVMLVCKLWTVRERSLGSKEREDGIATIAEYFLAISAGLTIGLFTSLILSKYVHGKLAISIVFVLIALTLVGFHYVKISNPHKSENDNALLPYAWVMIFASVSFFAQSAIIFVILEFLTWAELTNAQDPSLGMKVSGVWFGLLVAAYFLIIYQTNVHRANANNWLYRAYRNNLVKRFTPGAPTKNFSEYRLAAQGMPYPIINATRTDGLRRERFEITPTDSGTDDGERSSTAALLPKLALGDAIAISGSALDALGLNIGLKSIVGFIAAGTGYWVPISSKLIRTSLGVSFSHLAITMGLRAKIVLRLTDGGFSENLGVASLIRRKVDTIYCLDSEYDRDFKFEGLQKLIKISSAKYNARIELQGLAGLPDLYRMRQNKCSIIPGVIHYFDLTGEKLIKSGKYFHIKINNSVFDHKGNFTDFPYFPTTDQRLEPEQIESLCQLGESLARECIDQHFI